MKRVHFIGIGGAGMAPLASLFASANWTVSGSDLKDSPLIQTLINDYNVRIEIGEHKADNIQKKMPLDLVVYTSAANENNPERLETQLLGVDSMRRGDALAFWTKRYKRLIAVSGSHGKTTITAMLGHLLQKCSHESGFIVGGKVNTWKMPAKLGADDIFATEADESDGSHTALFPFLGIVSNIEDDHAWSVGGEKQLMKNFTQFGMQSQHLVYIKSEISEKLYAQHPDAIKLDWDTISVPNALKSVENQVAHWADFQIANAVTAITALEKMGFERNFLEQSIVDFPGVSRRIMLHYKDKNSVLIEDYAHHPTELRVLLDAMKKLYPNWYTQVIFQPHRYQRLKRYIYEFSAQLKTVDSVIVTPVFAAWVNSESISHHDLVTEIGASATASIDNNFEEIAKSISICHCHPEYKGTLTLVVGAGDIQEIIPHLLKKTQA